MVGTVALKFLPKFRSLNFMKDFPRPIYHRDNAFSVVIDYLKEIIVLSVKNKLQLVYFSRRIPGKTSRN